MISAYIEDEKRARRGFEECMFRYIDRNANEATHRLVIEGIRGGGTTYLTDMTPSFVKEVVERDNRWSKTEQ